MRLIRNIEGEPRPLIMHPRLFWVREADSFVRDLFCNILGRYSRRPRYMTAEQTPEQHARTLLACEAFMGAMSPEPRLARYYLERSRLGMLADPTVSEARKRELVAEGPRCVPADEAYAQEPAITGHGVTARPEVAAALVRMQAEAEAAIVLRSIDSVRQNPSSHRAPTNTP